MRLIAIKTNGGMIKGKISFYCKMLNVSRQGYHNYLANKDKPWKYEALAEEMRKINSDEEYNDTYGRIRMHQALLLRNPKNVHIPSERTLNSFVGEPNSICTESYIAVGANKNITEQEALNLSKYLTTKFVRFLHKQAKASQDASSKTYRFIPMQEFNNESDINWEKAVNEIDMQLFDKYNLSQEEREHIENSIKDM